MLTVRRRQELALVFWVALIFVSSTGVAGELSKTTYQSIVPSGGDSDVISDTKTVLQKSYHVFLFGVLGWLLALRTTGDVTTPMIGILACVAIGSASEGIQLAYPDRTAELTDVLLNSLSSCVSYVWFMRKFRG